MYHPKELEKKLKKSYRKQKIEKIFQNKKNKRSMNILPIYLNKKKNTVIKIMMILITME